MKTMPRLNFADALGGVALLVVAGLVALVGWYAIALVTSLAWLTATSLIG